MGVIEELNNMRIMIFGKPGSGKTTYAFELSQKLNLPLFHIDKIFYTHNWIERNYEDFLKEQTQLVSQKNWIIDGNATKSFELRYARADVAIYFCYPNYLALWRIFKRKYFSKKDARIDDRAEGCSETIRWSLIKYLLTYEKRVQHKITELKSKYPDVKLYVVKKDKDLNKLLDLKSLL